MDMEKSSIIHEPLVAGGLSIPRFFSFISCFWLFCIFNNVKHTPIADSIVKNLYLSDKDGLSLVLA
jgi:hypothetical protein